MSVRVTQLDILRGHGARRVHVGDVAKEPIVVRRSYGRLRDLGSFFTSTVPFVARQARAAIVDAYHGGSRRVHVGEIVRVPPSNLAGEVRGLLMLAVPFAIGYVPTKSVLVGLLAIPAFYAVGFALLIGLDQLHLLPR